jgi:hypothetical protein
LRTRNAIPQFTVLFKWQLRGVDKLRSQCQQVSICTCKNPQWRVFDIETQISGRAQ